MNTNDRKLIKELTNKSKIEVKDNTFNIENNNENFNAALLALANAAANNAKAIETNAKAIEAISSKFNNSFAAMNIKDASDILISNNSILTS